MLCSMSECLSCLGSSQTTPVSPLCINPVALPELSLCCIILLVYLYFRFHCGRSLVCRFDDDISAFLEFVDGLFLLMGEVVLLRSGVVNLLVSRCLLLLLGCKFPVELDGFVGVSSCSSL